MVLYRTTSCFVPCRNLIHMKYICSSQNFTSTEMWSRRAPISEKKVSKHILCVVSTTLLLPIPHKNKSNVSLLHNNCNHKMKSRGIEADMDVLCENFHIINLSYQFVFRSKKVKCGKIILH